jgi:hypothetical protein
LGALKDLVGTQAYEWNGGLYSPQQAFTSLSIDINQILEYRRNPQDLKLFNYLEEQDYCYLGYADIVFKIPTHIWSLKVLLNRSVGLWETEVIHCPFTEYVALKRQKELLMARRTFHHELAWLIKQAYKSRGPRGRIVFKIYLSMLLKHTRNKHNYNELRLMLSDSSRLAHILDINNKHHMAKQLSELPF